MTEKSALERAIDAGAMPGLREKLNRRSVDIAELVEAHRQMVGLIAVLSKRLLHELPRSSK